MVVVELIGSGGSESLSSLVGNVAVEDLIVSTG